MSGASVQLENAGLGTITDESGQFLISLSKLPDTLKIRYIGLKTYLRSIGTPDFLSSDTLHLNLILQEQAEILEVVDVRANTGLEFYEPPAVVVIDYAVSEDGILVLQKSGGSKQVCRLSEEGLMLNSIDVPVRADHLVRDCLHQVYLFLDDSLSIIKVTDHLVTFGEKIPETEFVRRVRPCISANNQNLYFYFGGQLELFYSQSDHQSEQSKPLYYYLNDDELYSFREYLADARMERAQGRPFKAYEMEMWHKNILSKFVYGDLVATDTGAIVFNYALDSAFIFNNSGNIITRLSPQILEQKDFSRKIVWDKAANAHYALFEANGLLTYWRLNVGLEPTSQFSLSAIRFPRQPTLWNGHLYFLQYDTDDMNRRKLYRMPIPGNADN